MNLSNKWTRAAMPALLLHLSIGTVYAFSIFKADLAQSIVVPNSAVEWSFSIAILFLGLSAAFMGKFVERNIKNSALISLIFYIVGLVGTGVSVRFHFLIGVYIFYGVIMGIGLGIGYLTPVKNLVLWFSKRPGLGTGLAVAGFGGAKAIFSPLMEYLVNTVGVEDMFYILAVIQVIMMFAGYLLITRPPNYSEKKLVKTQRKDDHGTWTMVKSPVFIGTWLFFFINITCGLVLISQEKDILKVVAEPAGIMNVSLLVAVVLGVNAFFNAVGRLGIATLSDKFKKRETAFKIAFTLEALVCGVIYFTGALDSGLLWVVIIMMITINCFYGAEFSTMPVLLKQHFGVHVLSRIHGLILSAWGFAGIASGFIITGFSHNYALMMPVMGICYIVGFGLVSWVQNYGKIEH